LLFKEQRFASRFSASGRETRHADGERSEQQQPNRLLENAERQGESTERSQRYGIGERSDERSRAEKTDSNVIAEDDGNEDDGQTSLSDAAEFFPLLYEDDFNSAEVGSEMTFLYYYLFDNNLPFYSFKFTVSRSQKLKNWKKQIYV
jgi:hypothetical protein